MWNRLNFRLIIINLSDKKNFSHDKKNLCLGGVIGAKESCSELETKNVVLEVAIFDLDGLILDSEVFYAKAWSDAFNLNSPKQLGEILFDKLQFSAPCSHTSLKPPTAVGAAQGCVSLVAHRSERNFFAAFFFWNFSFCAFLVKKKSGLTVLSRKIVVM